MFDLNYVWVDVNCPKCGYQDRVQLVNAKTENVMFCNNCKSSIQLMDSEASVHNSIESVNKAFKSFESLFKNFGK